METLQQMIKQKLEAYGRSSELLFDPESLGKMKADSYNQSAGDLTGLDCPKCRNKGNTAVPIPGEDRFAIRDCTCMKARKAIWRMEKSGLKNVIKELTFEKYEVTQPWQGPAKEKAMDYAKAPEGWLLFCGQPGSGKTHLCTAVCRQRLLEGDAVVYMSWREEISHLKTLAQDSQERSQRLEALKNAQILYMDDLFKTGRSADGSSNPTQADCNLTFEILNYRYVNQKPTILSTEKTPGQLLEIDEGIGSRIVELAEGHTVHIQHNPRRNYRLRHLVQV